MKNSAYYFVFQIFLIINIEIVVSQPVQQWVAIHTGQTGSNVNTPHSIAVDDSGNIYVNGESYLNSGIKYCVTMKYSPTGVLMWSNILPHPASLESMVLDKNGNLYIGASIDTSSNRDFLIIKCNSNGSALWTRTVNGPGNGNDLLSSIYVDESGNVYACGSVYVSYPTNYAFEVVKFDSSGNRKWSAVYGSLGFSSETFIGTDANKNVYVGINNYASMNNNDYGVVKYDSNGAFQWSRSYDGPVHQHDFLHGMKVNPAGDIYLTGQSIGSGTGSDYATLKYNSLGDLQWEQRYNGTAGVQDYAYWIEIDAAGNAYVTGTSASTGSVYDYVTFKYGPAGSIIWQQRYNGPGNDEDVATCLKLDSAGNVYITGASNGGASATDYATVKYSSAGEQLWAVRYDGTPGFFDYASVLAADKNGNIIVTGKSQDSLFNYNFATVKYSQPIGIRQVSAEVPKDFALFQNFPNPFNPTTKIKFDIPANAGLINQTPTKLVIYDAIGRDVSTLVNQQLKAGSYEVEWNANNYSSGIYYYRISAGDYIAAKKMILLK